MRETPAAYLDAAAVAVALLEQPTIAASWNAPSVLPEFSVRGLAGHLARQVVHVLPTVAVEPPAAPPVSLIHHYTRSAWIGAAADHPMNTGIRGDGEATASEGPGAVAAGARASWLALEGALPGMTASRLVYLPWGPWSLSLDDYLVTRMVEISIHCDDLALSIGTPTPALPLAVTDTVASLLARVATRRHGATAVLRALARAERAPSGIAAI